jgi:hypothetical protein
LKAAAPVVASSAEISDNTPTQDDGQNKDEDENDSYCTQVVLPQEPKAFL